MPVAVPELFTPAPPVRARVLTLRVSEAEGEFLTARAEAGAQTVSEVVRAVLREHFGPPLEAELPPAPEGQRVA